MVRVTVPLIILFVVGYAFLVAVIVLFLDKYLDLRAVAYTADASRQATNLLHFLLTSNCTGAVKEKLVLDLYELGTFGEEEYLECSNLEYDYNFSITEIGNSHTHTIEKRLLFNLEDPCYLSYYRIKGYAEMPVVVYNYWAYIETTPTYRPAIANLTLMKTPLSELAFWVSQASLRIGRHDETVRKSIRVGPEVTAVSLEDGKICMVVSEKNSVKISIRMLR